MDNQGKVEQVLSQIEILKFSHLNCLKLISLIYKLQRLLAALDGYEIFKDDVRQTVLKELRDLMTFEDEDLLEHYFDQIIIGMKYDKAKNWDKTR